MTRSPRASATPTPAHPTACAAGPTGWPPCWRQQTPDFRYANLAIRGRKLDGVLAEQLEPAVALGPDLLTIYAGANDIMRPRVDIDGMVDRYDAALGKLAGTGARLLVFTAFDPGGSAIYRPLRGRFALYNELVRAAADRHGATIVDFWRMRELRDWRYWDPDRMHLGPAGHAWMALQVLDVLGVPHGVGQPELPPEVVLTRAEQRRANREWARTHLGPWVRRRLTGRSSGDLVTPKRPGLSPLE